MLRPLRPLQRPLHVRYSVCYVRYENAGILLRTTCSMQNACQTASLGKFRSSSKPTLYCKEVRMLSNMKNAATVSNTRPLQC